MKRLLLLIPVLSGILWGSSSVFVRTFTDNGIDNMTMIFGRMALASVLLFFVLLIYKKSLLKIRLKDIWIFILAGGVATVGLNFCYNYAINSLTVSLAAVLLSLMPVFVIIMSAALYKEKITSRKIICVLMAIAGCVLVSRLPEEIYAGTTSIHIPGVLLGLLSAIFYAAYSLLSRKAMKLGYHSFTITFYSILFSAIVTAFFTDYGSLGSFMTHSPIGNSAFLLVNTLCLSVLPYLLFNASFKFMDTGIASILASVSEPASAMIFGIIFFSEIPSVLMIVGLVVTVLAIAILLTPEKKRKHNINLHSCML